MPGTRGESSETSPTVTPPPPERRAWRIGSGGRGAWGALAGVGGVGRGAAPSALGLVRPGTFVPRFAWGAASGPAWIWGAST